MINLSPEKQAALAQLAAYYKPQVAQALSVPTADAPPDMVALAKAVRNQDIIGYGENNFYIIETQRPIRFVAHQPVILRYAFDPANRFQTILYSTVKKSGKTTIASLCAKWVAETWGNFNEVYCMANDMEQARGRVYNGIQKSIELDPEYNAHDRAIPDKWSVIGRELRCLSTNTTIKAVSSDYKGEAGSNPTATFWSELWGYTSEESLRLWDELTPVPTRPRSVRFVETYAGFEDESSLLQELWSLATDEGYQLTLRDVPDWPGPEGYYDIRDGVIWGRLPEPDLDAKLPLYRNDAARLFAYIDTGEVARRMPWQTPDYYQTQSTVLRDKAFRRLHLNEWTTSISAFLPDISWWDACSAEYAPITDKQTPLVLAADAAVSNDCCALVGMSRLPKPGATTAELIANPSVALRFCQVWTPPKGGSFDYDEPYGLEPTIRELCAKYDVVELAYDAYQLHQMMTRLRKEGLVWARPFSQSNERTMADKQLYDCIRDRRLLHPPGEVVLRTHLQNAGSKQSLKEDTKFRIVKKTDKQKIDAAVAAGMALAECLRLNL